MANLSERLARAWLETCESQQVDPNNAAAYNLFRAGCEAHATAIEADPLDDLEAIADGDWRAEQ